MSPQLDLVRYDVVLLATMPCTTTVDKVQMREARSKIDEMLSLYAIWPKACLIRIFGDEIIVESNTQEFADTYLPSQLKGVDSIQVQDTEYNNVLLMGFDPISKRSQSQIYAFHCTNKQADVIAEEMTSRFKLPSSQNQHVNFRTSVSSEVEQWISKSMDPVTNWNYDAGLATRQNPNSFSNNQPTESEVEIDVDTLHHCFSDIEQFLNATAPVLEKLGNNSYLKKLQKKSEKDQKAEFAKIKGVLPNVNVFIDVLQKIKLSFNLLGILDGYIDNPKSDELLHFLFTPLAQTLRLSSFAASDLALEIVSPLLTPKSKDFILSNVSDQERRLLDGLGAPWNLSEDEWAGERVAPFLPVFSDGFEPYSKLPSRGARKSPNMRRAASNGDVYDEFEERAGRSHIGAAESTVVTTVNDQKKLQKLQKKETKLAEKEKALEEKRKEFKAYVEEKEILINQTEREIDDKAEELRRQEEELQTKMKEIDIRRSTSSLGDKPKEQPAPEIKLNGNVPSPMNFGNPGFQGFNYPMMMAQMSQMSPMPQMSPMSQMTPYGLPPAAYSFFNQPQFMQPRIPIDPTSPRQRAFLQHLMSEGRTVALVTYGIGGDDRQQLNVSKGEYVEVVDRTGQWWECRNAHGQIGFVPSSVLQTYGLETNIPFSQSPAPFVPQAPLQVAHYRSPPPQRRSQPPPRRQPRSVEDEDEREYSPAIYKNELLAKVKKTDSELDYDSEHEVPRRRTKSTSPIPPAPVMRRSLELLEKEGGDRIHPRKKNSNGIRLDIHEREDAFMQELASTVRGKNKILKSPKQSIQLFITEHSAVSDIQAWLESKGFSMRTMKALEDQSGATLFVLSKKNLQDFCGKEEGSHVYSQLLVQKSTSGFHSRSQAELNAVLSTRKEEDTIGKAAAAKVDRPINLVTIYENQSGVQEIPDQPKFDAPEPPKESNEVQF